MTKTMVAPKPFWREHFVVPRLPLVDRFLQILSGAYRAEFAGYPDESAHYVTSLMVRDFIAGGNYTNPVQFADDYYAHYPKVALGHWPPLFYAFGGLWMLIFSASRQSVLLGMAVFTAVFAWITQYRRQAPFWLARRLTCRFVASLPADRSVLFR